MGEAAAISTKMFKRQSDSSFSIVLAEIFTFVVNDVNEWGPYLSQRKSPPLTALWPFGLVKRHVEFAKYFRVKRRSLFLAYEAEGGEYHGPETVPQRTLEYGKRARKNKEKEAGDSSSGSSTEEDVGCYEIDV